MTRTFGLPVAVVKEVRELSFVWIVSVLATGAAGLFSIGFLSSVGLVAYVLGPVALGALSIGHEYSQRTLGLLLSQPVSRQRLLLTKFAVLATMIVMLGAVALLLVLLPRELAGRHVPLASGGWEALVLPLVCGLLIAPWLTMLSGNPLAGIVFTLALPAGLWIVGGRPAIWLGTLVMGAIAATSSWRMFMRLEVIDGRDSDLTWPAWLGGSPLAMRAVREGGGSRRALWRIVAKELHIQKMTFVVAGLYVAAWFGVALTESSLRQFSSVSSLRFVLSVLYAGLVALLAGSLASAEERQLGTLEWQVLLPIAAWKQWAVKVGVAVGLSLGLGLGLPVLLAHISPPADGLAELGRFVAPPAAGIVVLLSAAGLYASSRSSNGLRAFLAALSAVLGFSLLAPGAILALTRPVFQHLIYAYYRVLPQGLTPAEAARMRPVLNAVLLGGFAVVVLSLLRLGFTNHRSADRGASRWRVQLVWIVCCCVIASLALWAGSLGLYPARGGGLARFPPAPSSRAPAR